MFVKFPSIESFDRIMARKAWQRENAPESHEPIFSLRPKVKLHGGNLAMGAGPGGPWVQNRSQVLSASDDLYDAHKSLIGIAGRMQDACSGPAGEGVSTIVFGEWAGPGIQKKDAVTLIERKTFFPFLLIRTPAGWDGEDKSLVEAHTDPDAIRSLMGVVDDAVCVLPWAGEAVLFDADDHGFSLTALGAVNERAEAVGAEDPFIREVFGVSGPGEGLVFVPDSGDGPLDLARWSTHVFKAKAERHRVKRSAKAATVRAEIPADAVAFADAFVTENRLEQMLTEKLGGELDKRRTGDFIREVVKDVLKESGPEREALGVSDKVISGLIIERAREWYASKTENDWSPSAYVCDREGLA